jgi:hypothetical protein
MPDVVRHLLVATQINDTYKTCCGGGSQINDTRGGVSEYERFDLEEVRGFYTVLWWRLSDE